MQSKAIGTSKSSETSSLLAYLAPLGKLRWLILAVPALAIIASVLVTLARPVGYTGTATVILQPTGGGSPISAATQATADYLGALSSDAGLMPAAAASSLPISEVRRRLSTRRLQSSSLVEVRAVASDPQMAVLLAEESSRGALVLIANSRLATAQAVLDSSQNELRSAVDAIESFVATTGSISPRDDLASEAGSLSSQELLRKARDVIEFERLESRVQRAETNVQFFQRNLDEAQAAYEVASAGTIVIVSDAVPEDGIQRLVRVVVPVTGLSVVLTVLVLLLISLITSPRTRRPDAEPEPTEE